MSSCVLDEQSFRRCCHLLLQQSEQLNDGWSWEQVQVCTVTVITHNRDLRWSVTELSVLSDGGSGFRRGFPEEDCSQVSCHRLESIVEPRRLEFRVRATDELSVSRSAGGGTGQTPRQLHLSALVNFCTVTFSQNIRNQ